MAPESEIAAIEMRRLAELEKQAALYGPQTEPAALIEMLPEDRQPFKARFQTTMGTLWAEIIGGSTVMAAGVVTSLEKQVGSDES